ncbi:MAG: hypothetical protein RJB66_760 [Pseudomonadota bacterium]
MWAIRMLSGSHAGQVFPLKEGRTLIGRGPSCQIRFNDMDVSKEHAHILVENDRLSVVDNQSRNGTFVNGILVNKASLKRGDKISFNQTMCDVIQLPTPQARKASVVPVGGMNIPNPGMQGYGMAPQPMMPPGGYSGVGGVVPNMGMGEAPPPSQNEDGFLKRYFEEVLMPGVYHLAQVMEFKLVIGLFMLIFAVGVTALSTIPMIAISSDSIQIESRRRALTIARNLANVNQQALLKEMDSALSTQTADLEEGVSQSYIIRQSDGSVIAPATKAGMVPSLPFIETARREQKELVQQIDSSHVAVAVPLSAFNPDTATYTIKAFAVVVYDMGALAVDDGRTLSLFFQTLIIAIALGFVLYYLFYRFIEHPVAELNKQIDNILKGNGDSTADINIDFPQFQNLVSNVNTILTRLSSGDGGGGSMGGNKDLEVLNIVRLVGYAGIAITADYNILGLNAAAEHLLGVSESQLRNQPLTMVPDQALQKSLYDLMEHASRDTAMPSKNELEFGGENTEINCQAMTDKGKVTHYLVTIIPMGGVG